MRQIHNDDDYKAALNKVSPWFDNEPQQGTSEAAYFEELVILIQAYEAKHFSMPPPAPP